MSLFTTILLVILILLLCGGFPGFPWGYAQHFGGGYRPMSVVAFVLVIVVVLIVLRIL